MSSRIYIVLAGLTVLAMSFLSCSDDTPVSTSSQSSDIIRLFLIEETGRLNTYAFNPLDQRSFEYIEDLEERRQYDFSTCDAEYYDVFFSTALGEPLNIDPRASLHEPIYITIRCFDLGSLMDKEDSAARWEESGNNIDALTLSTLSGPLFGEKVVRVSYGPCDEPLAENEWPVTNALGPPDDIVTHLGGGLSSMTIRMGTIPRGSLGIFERSNTPPVTIVHSFPTLDRRLYEKLPELSQEVYDLVSADCELYDLYFSDADGVPLDYSQRLELPDPVYVTIDCLNLNCDTLEPDSYALWSDADDNIDALRLSFAGWHRFASTVTRISYGTCGQAPAANEWPVENMLGIPDGDFSRMGGGFSSVTVMLADTTS